MVTRRMKFSGVLFDGQSANKKLIQIELIPQHIPLTVSDGSVVNWSYSILSWDAETIP